MKLFYVLLTHPKIELLKWMLGFFMVVLYQHIYQLIYGVFANKYEGNNLLYIGRLLYIVILVVLLYCVRKSFRAFLHKNEESLILLGVSVSQRLLLFFFTKYEVIFLSVYFGAMLFRIQNQETPFFILVNVLNIVIVCVLAMLMSERRLSKIVGMIIGAAIGVLGILMATEKLSYDIVYAIVMSEVVTRFLFSASVLCIAFKCGVFVVTAFVLIYIYVRNGMDIVYSKSFFQKQNLLGDGIHRLSMSFPGAKRYLQIYQNKDYIIWKIFSTTILLCLCYLEVGHVSFFLTCYVLCLISAMYFKDIYDVECTLQFCYYMSNYSYNRLMRDFIINGFVILGDNLLLILLLRCMFDVHYIVVLFGIVTVILFMSLFVNCHLFSRYPSKQYYINVLLIMIKLHIPVLQFYFCYRSICQSKKIWESLKYEEG